MDEFSDEKFSDDDSDDSDDDDDQDDGAAKLARREAMDKLVPGIDPSEYGKMPISFRNNSQRVAPTTVSTDTIGGAEDDGQVQQKPVRAPILMRDRYEGVDSDDETDEEDEIDRRYTAQRRRFSNKSNRSELSGYPIPEEKEGQRENSDLEKEEDSDEVDDSAKWTSPDDNGLPTIIYDPGTATPLQRLWIDAMSDGKGDEIKRRFELYGLVIPFFTISDCAFAQNQSVLRWKADRR